MYKIITNYSTFVVLFIYLFYKNLKMLTFCVPVVRFVKPVNKWLWICLRKKECFLVQKSKVMGGPEHSFRKCAVPCEGLGLLSAPRVEDRYTMSLGGHKLWVCLINRRRSQERCPNNLQFILCDAENKVGRHWYRYWYWCFN